MPDVAVLEVLMYGEPIGTLTRVPGDRILFAKARLPEKIVLDTARETVALFHQHWRAEKANLPLSTAVIEAVEAHIKTIPIA